MKYINLGHAILVPIADNYSVMGLIKRDKDKNTLTLYLNRKDIPIFDLIDEVEDMVLSDIDKGEIIKHINNFIEKCFNKKLFDKYISRFEYQQQCFDIGSEVLNEWGSETVDK